jgi:hypothetical protein
MHLAHGHQSTPIHTSVPRLSPSLSWRGKGQLWSPRPHPLSSLDVTVYSTFPSLRILFHTVLEEVAAQQST